MPFSEYEVCRCPHAVRESVIRADKINVMSQRTGNQRTIWKRGHKTHPSEELIIPYGSRKELRNIVAYVDQLKNGE